MPSDLPRLAELVTLGEGELRPMRGGDVWAAGRVSAVPIVERLAAELADPAHLVVTGTIDDVPVGYARVTREVLADGRALGVIDDLFVEPAARGIGVGEAMAALVVSWCEERRCTGIDAVALPGHRATKNFFEESGFTARLLVMHRDLREVRVATEAGHDDA